MNSIDDTIVALSTPSGTGGLSVVRLSGALAIDCTEKIFTGKTKLSTGDSHTAYFGKLVDFQSKEIIDQVVVTIFKAPHSYTGEDVVEVSCHGGNLISGLIIQNYLNMGLRLAEPGEFTRRAFANGKVDLAQAEAVADLINSKTRLSLASALDQLEGHYSQKINSIREKILDLTANLELELDFSEEDIELKSRDEIVVIIDQIISEQERFIQTFRQGKLIHEGVKVGLAGRPNVGKSSLFNAILGYERAIVDETPGTTRDAIEVQLDIEGIYYRLIDTAGLRESDEKVEQKGMGIALEILKKVDILLMIFDASTGFTAEDRLILERLKSAVSAGQGTSQQTIFYIWNKIDLGIEKKKKVKIGEPQFLLSAKTGEGLDVLHDYLSNYLKNSSINQKTNGFLMTNIRHYNLLTKSNEYLKKAREGLKNNLSNEFIAFDLRNALNAVGEIIGKTTTDEILNHIFDKFCIGK